jgi:hypothetical protein
LSSPLPTDHQARKDTPIARGVLDYFPGAIAEIARVSKIGNDQHNPGQEMHWARGKSTDHADCIVRHLIERGTVDTDGIRHSAKAAWRVLALLQEELEAAGAAPGRASVFPEPESIFDTTKGERLDKIIEKVKNEGDRPWVSSPTDVIHTDGLGVLGCGSWPTGGSPCK